MKLVIFDCDGTLVDSQHMIVRAMEQAFAAQDLPAPGREAILSVVGLSLPTAVARLVSEPNAPLVERLAEDYKLAFQDLRRDPENREPLYPGIRDVIGELARREDVLLGIATGKSRRGLDAVLAREGLSAAFHTVQTADTHPSKPDPSMLWRAMTETGVGNDQTLMVGDTTFDMEMAKAAGVASIGVSWGYHGPSALRQAGARCVLDAAHELPPLVGVLLDGDGGAP